LIELLSIELRVDSGWTSEWYGTRSMHTPYSYVLLIVKVLDHGILYSCDY